jgi:hypothetical protein
VTQFPVALFYFIFPYVTILFPHISLGEIFIHNFFKTSKVRADQQKKYQRRVTDEYIFYLSSISKPSRWHSRTDADDSSSIPGVNYEYMCLHIDWRNKRESIGVIVCWPKSSSPSSPFFKKFISIVFFLSNLLFSYLTKFFWV